MKDILKREREKGCSIKPLKLDMFEKPKVTKKMLKHGDIYKKHCVCFPKQGNLKIYFNPEKKTLDNVIKFWRKQLGNVNEPYIYIF